MTYWSLYWPDWLVAHTLNRGTPTVVHGGWNQNTGPLRHLRPGDTLLLTAGFKGQLHLLGGLQVEQVGGAHPDAPHSCGSSHVEGVPLADIRIDRVVPFSWFASWRFVNADGKRRDVPHDPTLGRLEKTNAFRGCYRLAPHTGERLQHLLEGGELLSADPILREIEVKRACRPEDDALARVHMDALLERGDPRGPIIALELAGAHRGERKARRELLQLLKVHPGVLGRPGGFPFRTGWGLPKKLR